MDYDKLLHSLKKLDATEQNILRQRLKIEFDDVKENVIISPSWELEDVSCLGEAELISSAVTDDVKVWIIRNNDTEITYIKTGLTSPHLLERILPLGFTACKRIIFIGSVGSLDKAIQIGDVLVPEFSVFGDGASRYIASDDLKLDVFGEKTYPDSLLFKKAIAETAGICEENNIKWHIGKTFSTDTVFAEFAHIDTYVNMGCNSIEMETAVAFRAAKIMKIPLVALLAVSDNTLTKKSLLSGRTPEEMEYYRFIKRDILPQIILSILQ